MIWGEDVFLEIGVEGIEGCKDAERDSEADACDLFLGFWLGLAMVCCGPGRLELGELDWLPPFAALAGDELLRFLVRCLGC
jgi:hypothetical protein